MNRTPDDRGYLMPTAAVSLLLVMLAASAVVTASGTRWLSDRQDRRAADEALVRDYAWPEITHAVRRLTDPNDLFNNFGDGSAGVWRAVGGGSCEVADLPEPPATLDCWKIVSIEPDGGGVFEREGRTDLPLELARIRVRTGVDCAKPLPPATEPDCALLAESERTYRRRRLLYFQAHYTELSATPRAGSGASELAFASEDILGHIHFTGSTLPVCGQPIFDGIIELSGDETYPKFDQTCNPPDPTGTVVRVTPLEPGRSIVGDDPGDCPATIEGDGGAAWLKEVKESPRATPPGVGNVVDLTNAADGDIYYSDDEVTVSGMSRAGASVTVASLGGITVDLSTDRLMGTGLPNMDDLRLIDLGDITPQATRSRGGSLDGEVESSVYYEFELTDSRRINLALLPTGNDADLYLEDTNGAVIASSENAGANQTDSVAASLTRGTYLIRIEARALDNITTRLTYRTSGLTGQQRDALESNGFAEKHAPRYPVIALISGCDVKIKGPAPVSHTPPYTPCPNPPPPDDPNDPTDDPPDPPEGCGDPLPPSPLPVDAESVMTESGSPALLVENDHTLAGDAAWSALTTLLTQYQNSPGIRLEARNVVVLAPHGGVFAEQYDLSPGNCGTPDPPNGATDPWTTVTEEDYEPCSTPTLTISGSVISKYRILVGTQARVGVGTTDYRHGGGFIKRFTYPEDFWRATPPWWPQTTGEYWYPL